MGEVMTSAAPQSLIRSGFFAVDQVYSFRKAQTSTFYLFVDLSKNPHAERRFGVRSWVS
jgi:hypothetical protein